MKNKISFFLCLLAILTVFYFYLPLKVDALNTNVNSPNFEDDYNTILKLINVNDCKINKLHLHFDSQTGQINLYQFQIIDLDENNNTYDIIYNLKKNAYYVTKNKKSLNTNNLINGEKFFKILDQINYTNILESNKSKNNYIITGPEKYSETTKESYYIDNDKITKLDGTLSNPASYMIKLHSDDDLIATYIFS